MALPNVTLKKQRTDRAVHPWIFDNEIDSGPGPAFKINGGLVRVRDFRGDPIGVGYCNTKSKIAIRYLTHKYDESIDIFFWKRRMAAALRYRRARYAADGGLPSAYRLIHGESDDIPGLVVDIYGEYAVAQFLALGMEIRREEIVQALTETLELRGIYERSDSSVRRLEGLEEQTGLLHGDSPPDILELDDKGLTIFADLKTGGKTGLFLDQRDNQRAAAREAIGRNVLNCFAYTGLFSLEAAKAGAASVTDIESSAVFNAVNQQQWDRNGFTIPHEIVTGNVFEHLRALDKAGHKTDMIVLDPPAFTKNRTNRDGALRGYNEINRVALQLLKPGGVLVSCSCSHHFTAAEFRAIVHGAARDAGRTLKLIAQRGQPPDHPVMLDVPESEYLKCLIFEVA